MLVGRTPGMWLTDDVVRMLRFNDAPPADRVVLDEAPGAAEQALVRALAMNLELRFRTPGEFARYFAGGAGSPRLDEASAKAVVERAAAIDAVETGDDDTYSLGGLERIAAEAGIPPAQMRRAADEVLPQPPLLAPGGMLGLRPRFEVERFVEGEVSPEAYPALLEEMRLEIGDIGSLNETLGEALSWSTGARAKRRTEVLISPKDGRTRIRIADDDGATPSNMVMIPITVGSVIALPITGAILDSLGVPWYGALAGGLTVCGALFSSLTAAARASFKKQMNERAARMKRVLERLVELANTEIGGKG
jgi:hypothetical protein